MANDTADKEVRLPTDPTFTRHYADTGLAYFLGRHVEVVFVQHGPALSVRPDDDGASYGVEAERAAVANIRIGVNGAVGLAMDILDEMTNVKALKREEIARKLDELSSRFRGEQVKAAPDKDA